ncbi:MAG: hypothetical protein VR72_12575 [Clostridiaceae bacterium BRH_c20a]|nr:MAG: hypothetical protein VR72_12575 [Clostridiaceae bacterium BRH_c20a]
MKKESTLSLVEKIYQKLRLDIYSSKIHQGAMLTEREIADFFNVSRTPVREALRKLEQEGLITIIPKKGSIVKQITLQDILEMDQIRELLEPYVAKIAAQTIDVDLLIPLEKQLIDLKSKTPSQQNCLELLELDGQLHNAIMQFNSNSRINSILNNLRKSFNLIRLKGATSRYQDSINEQLEIIGALKERNGKAAEKAMFKHIEKAKKNRFKIIQP